MDAAHRALRDARAADLPRLIEIARRSWLSAFAQHVPFEVLQDWIRKDFAPAWYERYWPSMRVLEERGSVIGLVQPKDDEINGLWVHPEHQGTGVGTVLLREGERIVAADGHARAWLVCSTLNQRALEFYRRRGYRETARLVDRHPCGIDEESVRMERVLGEREVPRSA